MGRRAITRRPKRTAAAPRGRAPALPRVGHGSAALEPVSLAAVLDTLGVPPELPFEELTLPMILIDRCGVVRWQNRASEELIGSHRGSDFAETLPQDYRRQARERFAAFLLGGAGPSDADLVVERPGGRRVRVAITTLPLRSEGGGLAGLLGIVRDQLPKDGVAGDLPALPPRQRETLELLASGHSTAQIAGELGVTLETARNYVRRLLRSLGVHSRLEAVARARRTGLL